MPPVTRAAFAWGDERMKIVHLDYESRSRSDLTSVGAHRYAIDPSTEVLMAAVSEEGSDTIYLWVNPEFGDPTENIAAETLLASADEIYAHNAPFEQAITWGISQRGGTSPFAVEPDLSIWRCTSAMARKAGLPSSLEKCGAALKLDVLKDNKGKALIKFFSIPRDDGRFNVPQEHPEKWSQFCEYCRQDVRAEKAIHKKLKAFELTGAPLETFQFDLRMNQRGIPINVAAARHAQAIVDSVQSEVSAEFRQLTGLNPTQRAKVLALVQSLGVKIEDMQAETLSSLTVDQVICSPKAARILELYSKLSYAAIKKVQTMLDCVCPDGVIRGTFKYYGAGTGRWSAGGLQPHNFKKTPEGLRPITDEVYRRICDGWTAPMLGVIYGEPFDLLAGCIRNFIHLPGTELLDGDYSGIEARIIAWLAGQEDVLQQWRDYDSGTGLGPYKYMAASIYGIRPEAVTKDQREVGKRVVLGAGFGMGPDKFQSSCRDQYQLDLPYELCQLGIKTFRASCPSITKYWYMLDNCCREAIAHPGATFGPFTVRQIAGLPYLLGKLPSGRSLAYPYPEVNARLPTPAEEKKFAEENWSAERITRFLSEISYWGQLLMSQQWGRVKLYGGKLAENFTQAVAADFMAHGAIHAERQGMPPFMLVHDQGLSLRPKGKTADDYAAALANLPAWARGFPMKVEADVTPYFKK